MEVTEQTNRMLIFRMFERQNVPAHALRSLTSTKYRLDLADVVGLFTKQSETLVFSKMVNPFALERQIIKIKRGI